MVRVLHVINSMGFGGAETLIMNLYRQIDRERVQFDFVVHTDEEQFFDSEIIALGGKIFRTKRFGIRTAFAYRKWWRDFFRDHPEYKVVHGHIGSTAAIYLDEARKSGAFAIAHSHNVNPSRLHPRDLAWNLFSYPTRFVADYFFACSMDAAASRFGKKTANSPRCHVLKNSIDAQRFRFTPGPRERTRNQLGLRDEFLVGHVGRMTAQKNHSFLLDIFLELKGIRQDAVLLLVGEGELERDIRSKCMKLCIDNSVIFARVHENVEDYYAAMDVFVFPSLWEGFGNVVVEAQTNGLPCVASTAVPTELADMGAGLFETMDLSRSPREWAEAILRYEGHVHDANAWRKTVEHGFDSRDTASKLQEFYIGIAKNGRAQWE